MSSANKSGAALVTGGAIRLGRAISLALAEAGYDIALHSFSSKNEAEKTALDIRRCGVKCKLFSLDLRQSDAIPKLMENVRTSFPNLNLLVNNASRFKHATIRKTRQDFFEEMMAINFRAPFFLTKEFATRIESGDVINILDTKVFSNDFDYAVYYLSKKALAAFTRMAALEFAPNIRVNAVAPGPTIPTAGTGMVAFDKATVNAIPLKRTGTAKDVTTAVLHLVQNTFINGHILTVDGGESLAGCG